MLYFFTNNNVATTLFYYNSYSIIFLDSNSCLIKDSLYSNHHKRYLTNILETEKNDGVRTMYSSPTWRQNVKNIKKVANHHFFKLTSYTCDLTAFLTCVLDISREKW